MQEIKMYNWSIKTGNSDYVLWHNENQVMIEYHSLKLAVITVDDDNKILVQTIGECNCYIDKEHSTVGVFSIDDINSTRDYQRLLACQ